MSKPHCLREAKTWSISHSISVDILMLFWILLGVANKSGLAQNLSSLKISYLKLFLSYQNQEKYFQGCDLDDKLSSRVQNLTKVGSISQLKITRWYLFLVNPWVLVELKKYCHYQLTGNGFLFTIELFLSLNVFS